MFNNFSETPSLDPQELVQWFQTMSQRGHISGPVPMIFVPREDLASSGKIEERMLNWFRKQGFDGERDLKSNRISRYQLSGGYDKLLDKLTGMPDPAYQGHLDQPGRTLVRTLAHNEIDSQDDSKLPNGMKREELKKWLDDNLFLEPSRESILAQVLGSYEIAANLYRAVVQDDADEYPESRVVDGTPDLFLWHPEVSLHLWFFAEVKGPGDSLKPSQATWFKKNWKQLEGRVILAQVL